ncbi:SGNH/GDSL hydrolase family protein [Naasia lichenicola]|uniref:SGNH/GDSL hydrolase family protein n=1 Tax=Naasia lichenicola TaxID=2565933 RepID=UPI00130E29EB|nr:SGNH/GDSL hydrolase family protein [Naasia lichenicola]
MLAITLTGCSAGPRAPATEPETASLVVLGDSLSGVPARACPGCTAYPELYAEWLGTSVGVEVELHADAVDGAQLADVAAAVTRPEVVADLAGADVVLVWVGNNDGPPYNPATPCGPVPGDSAKAQAMGVEGYDASCIEATMRLYGRRYAGLFEAVHDLSPDASARFALATYDNWRDNPAFVGDAFPPERLQAINDLVVPIYDAWNATQCASAEANGFACIDTYHLINGMDGREPVTSSVGPDFTHLSQAGHEAVAHLLESVEVSLGWGDRKSRNCAV